MICPSCSRSFPNWPGTRLHCPCGNTLTREIQDLDPEAEARAARALEAREKDLYAGKQLCKRCRSNECGKYDADNDTCPTVIQRGLERGQVRAGKIAWMRHNPAAVCPDSPKRFGVPLSQIPDHFPTLAAPYLTEAELLRDADLLVEQLAPLPIRRIVGVPRSGMMPAAKIACRLGVPLASIDRDGLVDLATGVRLRDHQPGDGLTVIVEDSSASGHSLREVRAKLGDDPLHRYAAIYATPTAAETLDFVARILPLPHWFGWNLWHNPHLLGGFHIGTDFDGVMCPDCEIAIDDDGPRYTEWLRDVRPVIRGGEHQIPVIITARLERYRPQTEHWLRRHHIRYGRLVMGPWATPGERTIEAMADWKASQIVANGCRVYVESSDLIAQAISRQWTGPVICTDAGTTYVDGSRPQWHHALSQF